MPVLTSFFLYLFLLFAAPYLPSISHVFRTTEIGQGTIFWAKGDHDNPNPENYCYRRARHISKYLNDKELAIAHNTLPCGSWVIVFNPRTKKRVVARVTDRGPRHGIADLSRATAKAIRLNGKEQVVVLPMLR